MSDTVIVRIDGRRVGVSAGCSVAAALWNAGQHVFRASSGGEARAPLCGMGSCFECRVTIDGVAHVRACLTLVRDGMDIRCG